MSEINSKRLRNIAELIPILESSGFEFNGIEFNCISCSDLIVHKTLRGVDLIFGGSELERMLKGGDLKTLSRYVGYGGEIYKLIG